MTGDLFDGLREGDPGCPSDLALDRLHHGELDEAHARSVRAHVDDCARCAARLAERQQGFARLQVDERRLLAGIRRGLEAPPGWRARLLPAFGLLAALAAAALVAVLPALRAHDDGTRFKGGLALHVYRFRAGHAEPAVSGDRFAAGDRLRFAVDLPSDGFVRIVGVEADGSLFTAWPLETAAKTRFAAGQGIALDGAVALDARAGQETLYLVHCPPQVGEPSCAAGKDGRPSCNAGCALTPFVLEKGP